MASAQRGYGTIPMPFYSVQFRAIDSRHQQETVADIASVLWLKLSITFHIRLSQAEINVEIFVACGSRNGYQQHAQK